MTRIGFGALAAVALAACALPTHARAGDYRYGVGGYATGAVVGVPLGGPYVHPGYAPIVGYEPFSFDAPFPIACPGGYWAHRPYVDRWGHIYRYSEPRFFCP